MHSDSNGHAGPAGAAASDVRRRYSIGDFVLDTARREITGPALEQPYRLAPKTQQVLLALMERAGDVLTRDELLRKVWAGTLPTDYVLGQAITQLRKAFGDARGHAVYIETISKSGYRLCVDVAALDDPPASGIAAAREPPRQRDSSEDEAAERAAPRRPLGWLLVAGLLLATAVVAWLALGRRSANENAAAAEFASWATERITARLGNEVHPALSPDGAFVAYAMREDASSGFAIHMQATAPTPPRTLTAPPPGNDDRRPRWSPDGRKLLFLRIGPAGCSIMEVPASGGTAVVLGDCAGILSGGVDWSPDGRSVIAGTADAGGRKGGLRAMDIHSGRWRELPYDVPAGTTDFNPRVSPDGKWIGFQRGVSDSSLWRIPITGGNARQLTRAAGNITSWTWLADGKSIVFSSLGTRTGVVRVDLETGRQQDLPLEDVIDVDAARSGPALVFSSAAGRLALSRYRLTARGPVGEPEALFLSSASDSQGNPSPNGAWLAFYSDRTQTTRLWFGQLDDSQSARAVDELIPLMRHPPSWSPDSRSVWVIGRLQRTGPGSEPDQVYQVDVASGHRNPVRLPSGAPIQVIALPQRRLLVVADTGNGRLEMQLVDVSVTPHRIVRRMPGVGDMRFDGRSGAIYFVRTDMPGVRKTDIGFESESVVDPAIPARYWHRRWLAAPAGVQGVVSVTGCTDLWSAPSSQPAVDPRCLSRGQPEGSGVAGVPTTDPAGRWLYVTHTLPTTGIDIGMAILPR